MMPAGTWKYSKLTREEIEVIDRAAKAEVVSTQQSVINLSRLCRMALAAHDMVDLIKTIVANSQHSETRVPEEFIDKFRKALAEWEKV